MKSAENSALFLIFENSTAFVTVTFSTLQYMSLCKPMPIPYKCQTNDIYSHYHFIYNLYVVTNNQNIEKCTVFGILLNYALSVLPPLKLENWPVPPKKQFHRIQ